MKKILFSALVATVALGGAFVSKGDSKVTRTPGIYYDPSNSCQMIDCTGTMIDCSVLFTALPTIRNGTPGNYHCWNVEVVVGQNPD